MSTRLSLVSFNHLLGNKDAKKGTATILSQAEIRKIRQETEQGVKVDGVVISKSEIDRIKRSTQVMTKEQAIENKKLLSEQKEQQQVDAKARKTKMQMLDKERAAKIPKNENEVHNEGVARSILKQAEAQLDEEKDDVKHMN